jgi:hypothetical protein
MFLAALVLLVLAVWNLAGFEIAGEPFPVAVGLWYPFVGIPFGVIFLVVAIMRMSECGRDTITTIKKVLRRYALSLILILLRLIYLPVIELLVSLLLPVSSPCGDGYFADYTYGSTGLYAPFVNRTFECRICASDADICVTGQSCFGDTLWRVWGEPGLSYSSDIWQQTWFLVVFAILAIALGIPLLSWFILYVNRAIVCDVMVFGNSAEEKWENVFSRLQSTGVSIFSDFKQSCSYWAMVQTGTEFFIGVLPLLMKGIDEGLVYAFLVIFVMMSIFAAWKRPFMYRVNNALEPLTLALLALFMIIPCMRYHGTTVRPTTEVGWTAGFVVAPFLAAFAFIGGNDLGVSAEDPTIPTPQMQKEMMLKTGSKELLKLWTDPTGEDQIQISQRELQCVRDQVKTEEDEAAGDVVITECVFSASRRKLVRQITKMYTAIDILLDGATTNLIMRVLSVSVMAGFLAFGYYASAVTSVAIPSKCA